MLMSIAATVALTEWSERTVWRRFSGSMVKDEKSPHRSMVPFDDIQPHLCIPLEPEEIAVLGKADAGDAESQHEVALLFLARHQPKRAMYWLELAVKHGYADAMNLLGTCYLEGNGLPRDHNLGIVWIAQAAAHGHLISQRQMDGLRGRLDPPRGVDEVV